VLNTEHINDQMTKLIRGLIAGSLATTIVACTPSATVEITNTTAAPALTALEELTPLEELAATRSLWNLTRPTNYQFEITGGGCECNLAGRHRITVVED
jgi:hypothetical protein